MAYLVCSDRIDPARSRQLLAEAIACTRRSSDQLISCYLYNNAGDQALQDGDMRTSDVQRQGVVDLDAVGFADHVCSAKVSSRCIWPRSCPRGRRLPCCTGTL
jgi:hypothetical protein